VPKATIVSPMAKSDILYFFARNEAPSTNQLAPKIRDVKPTITSIKETNIAITNYMFEKSGNI
jgi:hypothetical protein